MLYAEFLLGGNSMKQGIEFTCNLVGSIFIGEKENIPLGSKILIRCDSAEDAQTIDNKMWESPKEMLIPHHVYEKNQKNTDVSIMYPGLKIDSEFNVLVNLNPDMPKDVTNYKYFYQIVIEDQGSLRGRAAESWKNCLELNIKPKFKK